MRQVPGVLTSVTLLAYPLNPSMGVGEVVSQIWIIFTVHPGDINFSAVVIS